MRWKRLRQVFVWSFVAIGLMLHTRTASAETTLTMWSFWGNQESKHAFIDRAINTFHQQHPDATVKVTWYDKNALYAALKTALRAGQGPDVFYAEVDQTEYVDNGFLLDLSKLLDWSNIEPWAKQAWTFGNGVYGLPLEAWTAELYYNKDMLNKLGFTLPADLQYELPRFIELIRKTRAAGITPISLGVGDRPYPGAMLTEEALLKELGTSDYGRLLKGDLKWSDPRVVKALTAVKQIIDAGALPKSFSSLTLGESHTYFYDKPGSLMFLVGSFYPSRAFNPPDQGGQPVGFPLGIMEYPELEGAACNECKTLAVGGSFVVNAATKAPKLAAAFLDTMATPEMGKLWVETVLGQTGIKVDMAQIGGPHAAYFRELGAADAHSKYFLGLPMQVMQGARREAFTQIINQAFPAGLLSVQEVVKRMDAVQQ